MSALTTFRLLASLAVVVLPCCASQGVNVRGLPDGSYELSCKRVLTQCLDYAREVCKGGSYEVLYGADELNLYGTPGANVEGHRSRAIVHCLRPGQEPRGARAVLATEPPAQKPAASGTPRQISSARSSAARAACVPGTTQVCVGPAACSGGQACLADGTGFSPCDCGAAGSKTEDASGAPPTAPGAPSPP